MDVKKLRGDLAALQTKYDSDVSALRLDNALSAALSAAGAKNPVEIRCKERRETPKTVV